MGQSVKLGTGAMQVIRRLSLKESDIGPKRTMFEEGWEAL